MHTFESPTGSAPALLLAAPHGAKFGNIVSTVYSVRSGVFPALVFQYPLPPIVSMISLVVSGSFDSPSTLAAASSALVLPAGFLAAGVVTDLAAGFRVARFAVVVFFLVVITHLLVSRNISRAAHIAAHQDSQLPRACGNIQR